MTQAESHPADETSVPIGAPAQASTAPLGHRSRWFQFRLRTLMVVMFLITVPLAGFAWRLQRARRQAALVSTLESQGAGVDLRYRYDFAGDLFAVHDSRQRLGRDFYETAETVYAFRSNRPLRADPSPLPLPDAARFWHAVCELQTIRTLWVVESQISPAHVRGLSQNRELEVLMLYSPAICDEHLREIGELTNLRCAVVGSGRYAPTHAPVSVEGVKQVAQLPNLEQLAFVGATVDDQMLRTIGRIQNLRYLTLCNTLVTDDGLEELTSLQHLRWLDLRATRVTASGTARLKSRLPKCEVKL